ncbi:hypothetical protein F5879DRAFT_975984 [Lentinula edodes]|nr:hypothetical protein F5879DRAFT_975984 [Lentinula edodes]
MEGGQNDDDVPRSCSLLNTNPSIFCGPCFYDESPDISTTADAVSTPSPCGTLAAKTAPMAKENSIGICAVSSEQSGPPMTYVTSLPGTTADSYRPSDSTAPTLDHSASFTTEAQSPLNQTLNIQDSASESSSLSVLTLSSVLNPENVDHSLHDARDPNSPSLSHILTTDFEAHPTSNAPNFTDKYSSPPSPQLSPDTLSEGRSSFVEDSIATNSSRLTGQQLQIFNLPSSTTSREALIFSLSSPSATVPAIKSLSVNEIMLPVGYNNPDLYQNAHRDYPTMEPPLIGSQRLSVTTNFSLELSLHSPPSALRPALMTLPNSGPEHDIPAIGALTSMHNLLTSLSQDQISGPTFNTKNDAQEDESGYAHCKSGSEYSTLEPMLPSSSPDNTVLTSSSPPNSSPPQLFSSSPSGTPTTMPMSIVTERRSPPPVFLHRSYPKNAGAVSSPDQQVLSQEFEPISPLLFAQSDDQDANNLMRSNPVNDDFTLDNSSEPDSMVYHTALPITSSPMPSSSPKHETPIKATSSSPGSTHPVGSPTMAFSSPPRKRKRDREEEVSRSLPGSPVKRLAYMLPAPKRSTIASHRRQHRKLATPFKSPLMTKQANLDAQGKVLMGPPAVPADKPSITMFEAGQSHASAPPSTTVLSPTNSTKRRFTVTARAAAQFKSPLSFISMANSSPSLPQVRLTPNMQSLERKIQILKRALKVKKDNEEKILADLTARWTEAGREVAWEVWELVKNNGDSPNAHGSSSLGSKRALNDSWGWDVQGDQKRVKSEDSWGWSTADQTRETDETVTLQDENAKPKIEDEEEESIEYTLGTMLRRLGIDPATLGWDDGNCVFEDP